MYYISVCVQLCSGGTEHDPGAMGAEGVAGVEHQRRALQRGRRRQHRRRQQPQHQPGHQVRLHLQQRHRLPHHQTVGSSLLILSLPERRCVDLPPQLDHHLLDETPERGLIITSRSCQDYISHMFG